MNAGTKVLSGVEVEAGDASCAGLALSLTEDSDSMTVQLCYPSDLFSGDMVKRMLGHYEMLLEGTVLNPDTPISAVPLLSPEERRQVLSTWNQSQEAYPDDTSLHCLFEACAAEVPDAVL